MGVGHGSESITVVLGRFDPVIARGLETILGDDRRIRILDSELSSTGLERALVRARPQVVILGNSAGRILERPRSSRTATAVLVFAHNPTPAYGMALLMAGVSCVAHSISTADLIDTVHLVARGDRLYAPSRGGLVERRYPSDAPPLTKREKEVVARLSEGKSYSVIAYELNIGVRTVETHAAHVRHKLHLSHKLEFVGIPIPRAWQGDHPSTS